MAKFTPILNSAVKKQGSLKAVEAKLEPAKSAAQLKRVGNDRWLSAMSKCIFQAGFNWQVIEDKWPNFEEAFEHFDIDHCANVSDADIEGLMKNDGIVRNKAKIASVGVNARFLAELALSHGNVATYFSMWSLNDYADNIQALQKETSRLGGKTGQVFLRRMGVDTVVLTDDVVNALTTAKVLNGKIPNAKKDWAKLQQALNAWHEESRYGLNEISQILALSVG